MAVSEWLTLLAIALGPLFDVWLAGHLQDRTLKRERRMDIFRTLMRTRRTPMWPDHVGALNLVEIEFARDRQVIDAWRELFKLGEERQRLLAKLLHAIAKKLDFKIEQLGIFEGGYTPQGWAEIEDDQTAIRRFAAQLAAGQRVLPIAVLDYTNVAQAVNAEPKPDKQSEAA